MKKRGFTLAEVLITLGIIGVVAALTAPQLVMSSKNEAACSKLATTVSNLENAFQNAMVQEEVSALNETRLWTAAAGAATAGQIGRYMHIGNATDNGFFTKSGVRVAFNKTASTDRRGNENAIRTAGGSLLFQIGSVDIFTTPGQADRPGRNQFRFLIGHDGNLYPTGSLDNAVYNGNGAVAANVRYDKSSNANGGNACNSTRTTLACTARIVDDGYKMEY
ncbi:prepilin-type N-terminal cleavage/methylation domain-containing protein [bacterium]|nr:prepilin-type N-terminal cleavage/methylation domain-containing protein [bacterium]